MPGMDVEETRPVAPIDRQELRDQLARAEAEAEREAAQRRVEAKRAARQRDPKLIIGFQVVVEGEPFRFGDTELTVLDPADPERGLADLRDRVERAVRAAMARA